MPTEFNIVFKVTSIEEFMDVARAFAIIDKEKALVRIEAKLREYKEEIETLEKNKIELRKDAPDNHPTMPDYPIG